MSSAKTDLASILEGFGLSEYEAKIYVALLKHGPRLMGELSFYAGVPRTKTYSTTRSLARKKLVAFSEEKPLKCQAIPPEECFEQQLSKEERRVRNLRRVVTVLSRLAEESKGPADVREVRYLVLGAQALTKKLPELIAATRRSINCVVDSWGLRLLEQFYDHLTAAISNDVSIAIAAKWDFDPSSLERTFPSEVDLRIGSHFSKSNVFVFDEETLLVVQGTTGWGTLIHSGDLGGIIVSNFVRPFLDRSIPARDALTLTKFAGGEEALGLLNNPRVERAFIKAVSKVAVDESSLSSIGLQFVSLLEEDLQVSLFDEPTDVAIPILNVLLRRSLGAASEVRYDSVTKLLTIEAPGSIDGGMGFAWVYAICGFLAKNNVGLEILQDFTYPNDKTRVLQVKIGGTKTELHPAVS